MTAFDTVWDLLKMPIVPHSFKELPSDGNKRRVFTALFEDPETEERLPMEGHYDSKSNEYPDPPFIESKIGARSGSGFEKVGSSPFFLATYPGTQPEHQRKGYATSVYDLAAAIAHRVGGRIAPSRFQTDEGKALWRGKKQWPVRDDL